MITVDDLTFQYPGTPTPAVEGISFSIDSGQIFGFLGPSGAGKTSIANLICRFYDPSRGQITIDGRDLRRIQLSSLRQQVAVVLSEYLVENAVRYAEPGLDLLRKKHHPILEEPVRHVLLAVEAVEVGADLDVGERLEGVVIE